MLVVDLSSVLEDPHPALVAATRPAPADVAAAAALLGWLPDADDRFRAAVPARVG